MQPDQNQCAKYRADVTITQHRLYYLTLELNFHEKHKNITVNYFCDNNILIYRLSICAAHNIR